VKIDPSGSRLLFSTYLGGSGREFGAVIKLDQSGTFISAAKPATASDYCRRTAGALSAAAQATRL